VDAVLCPVLRILRARLQLHPYESAYPLAHLSASVSLILNRYHGDYIVQGAKRVGNVVYESMANAFRSVAAISLSLCARTYASRPQRARQWMAITVVAKISHAGSGLSGKSPQGQKWWGMVTSRRALDAALVHDDLTTHADHFLCDRDGRPTRTHIVQPFCLQVHCDVHTSTATIIFGLAQQSAWEDKQQVRNEGGIDSASPTQRAIYYEHVSH
jgi:hypothetical protein